MTIKLIGMLIGLLVAGASLYYLVREKHDPESRKIYTAASIIGSGITAVCALLLFI